MKLKTISVGKNIKVGLPEYSNVDIRCDLQFEIAEGETVNWDEAWDEVNRQLAVQTEGIDPSWIKSREFSRFFKIIVKVPKMVQGETTT